MYTRICFLLFFFLLAWNFGVFLRFVSYIASQYQVRWDHTYEYELWAFFGSTKTVHRKNRTHIKINTDQEIRSISNAQSSWLNQNPDLVSFFVLLFTSSNDYFMIGTVYWSEGYLKMCALNWFFLSLWIFSVRSSI